MEYTSNIQKIEWDEFMHLSNTRDKRIYDLSIPKMRVYANVPCSNEWYAIDERYDDGEICGKSSEKECLKWFKLNEEKAFYVKPPLQHVPNAPEGKPQKAEQLPKEDGTAKGASHYQQAEIEPIEIMQMYFTKEMMLGFLIGNVIKYALRFRFKGSEEKDIEKMRQYADWAAIVEKGGKIKPRE